MWNFKLLVFCAVGIAAGIGATFVLRAGANTILREQAWQGGMELAGYIEREMLNLDQILAGDFDRDEAEAELQRLAVIGNIFRFEFYDAQGNELLTTGSFHSDTDDGPARHHAHQHEEQAAAHYSQPPVMPKAALSAAGHSGQRQARLTTMNYGEGHDHSIANHGSGKAIHHVLQIYAGDGQHTPETYAALLHPIADSNNNLRGTIVLHQDLSTLAALLRSVLLGAVGSIVALFILSTIGPLLSHLSAIREKTAADKKIRFLAAHDGLTGLMNRDTFISLVEASFKEGNAFAVHFIDVDNFKHLNDTFGHEVGDTVLRTIASRLIGLTGHDLTVARLGGDEFAVLQRNAKDAKTTTLVSEKIVEVMRAPILSDDHMLIATASVGSARATGDGENVTRLIKSADIAMYYAKSAGRDCARAFENWMDERLMARREVETRLRWSLEHGGFELHYQPLYSAKAGELLGFEALLRLKREDGTPISPGEFIPIAEEMRIIEEVGTWVLRQACSIAASWPPHLKLAVNLSVGQFSSGGLPEIVEIALWESKLPASQLELEITETFFLDGSLDTLGQLQKIKELGVRIAMDDFGTGYSSLSYLWQFPFDKVKIDQSFLSGFDEQAPRITRIIETIIGLGHTLGMQITAEGVETQEQLEMLKSTRCDQLQGYLLGRPCVEADVQICIDADPGGERPGLPTSA